MLYYSLIGTLHYWYLVLVSLAMENDVAESIQVQLKKGVLEMCVLALLSGGDGYAYEIAARLAQEIGMGEGTIYPLMRRMQSDGLVSTYLVEWQRPAAQILPSHGGRQTHLHCPARGMGRLCRGSRQNPGRQDMTRALFLAELRAGLSGMPANERNDIMADYEAYFVEGAAAGRSDADMEAALGDPARLAKELRAEAGLKSWEENRNPKTFIRAGWR